MTWIDPNVLKAERMKDIKRVATYRPKRKDIVLKGKVFKLGGGTEHQGLDVFSYLEDGN